MTTLSEIQKSLHVSKDKFNKHGNFNYRTAEGILASVKPLLPADGEINLSDHLKLVGDMVFLVATARLTIGDKEWTAQSAALHPRELKGMSPSQVTGAASSYARKYALCGLFAVDDSTDDPDANERPAEQRNDAPPPFDPAAARDRILKRIAAATTAEQAQKVYDEEAASGPHGEPSSLRAIKDAAEPMYLQLKRAFTDAGKRLPKNPAGQAPAEGNPEGLESSDIY